VSRVIPAGRIKALFIEYACPSGCPPLPSVLPRTGDAGRLHKICIKAAGQCTGNTTACSERAYPVGYVAGSGQRNPGSRMQVKRFVGLRGEGTGQGLHPGEIRPFFASDRDPVCPGMAGMAVFPGACA